MEITDLSDILSESIFGELSDHILDDIDIHVFDNFKLLDEQYTNDGERIEQRLKEETRDNIHASSRSTSDAHSACQTLEALLRSANPPSRVPPAPELHSDTAICLKKEQYSICNGHFRDSSPIVAQSVPFAGVKNAIKNPCTLQGKSKLIYQHLENSPTHYNSWLDTNESENVQLSVVKDKRTTPNHMSAPVKSCQEMQKDDDSASGMSTVKKAPHNAIEKRYRASINGRIDELRKILSPYRSYDEKLNKSAVLRKAIECIRDLEKSNQSLRAELASLQLALKGDQNGEHAISKTSPDSGISSLERSPCTRSLICQSNLSSNGGGSSYGSSGSDSVSFTSSPGLERHPWLSQQGQAQQTGSLVPTDGFTLLDTLTTDTASLRCLMSSSGRRELSPVGQQPAGIFEMDQPLVFSATTSASSPSMFNILDDYELSGAYDHHHHRPTLELTSEFSSGVGNTAPALPNGQPGQYVQAIEQSVEPMWNTGAICNALPGEPHVKRNGDNWMTTVESGPTPRKLRRQLITSSVDGQEQVTPSSHVRNWYDYDKPDAPDCLGLDDRSASSSTCPTVRQLLMAPSSAMVQPLPPLRNVVSNSAVAADRSSSESASRFNTGLAARTTLCVTALCLIVLDPAVLFGKSITPAPGPVNGKSDAKSMWSSPARRLLLAGDWPDMASGSPRISWGSLALGLAQWTIAICLCLWACIKSQTGQTPRQVVPDGGTGTGLCKQGGVEEANRNTGLLRHWSNADSALRRSSWTIASQNLNHCLTELGDPLPEPSDTGESSVRSGSLGGGSRFRTLLDLVDSVCLPLPRWLYHFYGRCALSGSATRRDLLFVQPISSPGANDDGESSDEQHPVQLSLAAVRHRHMELCLLARYSGASFSLTSISSWRLVFAQLRSLLTDSIELLSVGARCPPECSNPGGCCPHRSQQMARTTAVVGRTVTLALFLRDCLGHPLLCRLALRMAIRLANCLPASSIWHRCLSNPTLLAFLRGGSVVRRTPRQSVICGCVTSSREGLLLAYLLPDLRTELSQTCCHAIFFGSDAAVCELEEDIASLTSLCRFASGSTCGDRPCRNGDTSRWWWSSLVPRLWFYRKLRVHSSGQWALLPPAASAAGQVDSPASRTGPAVPAPLPPPLPQLLQVQPVAYVAATADAFACPGDGQLAQALWLAYRCLLKSPGDMEVLSLAARACNLLTKEKKMCGSIVQVGIDGQSSPLTLDAIAWHFVCVDWTLSGLTRWLRKSSETLKPLPDRVQWINTYLKGLDILRQVADCLQSALYESGISSSLPRWMSCIISHYEAIGHIIGGANPVVVRLSMLHNRRSRSREEVTQMQAQPVSQPLSHYPISLSSSAGDQEIPGGDAVASVEKQQHSRSKHSISSSCRVVQSPGQ